MRASNWDEWAQPDRWQPEHERAVDEATTRRPILVPLFPPGGFSPQSECRHRGWITKGSIFVCMVCHKSGLDKHPAVRFLPKDLLSLDPKPEPDEDEPKQETPLRKLTRRLKRALMFNSGQH